MIYPFKITQGHSFRVMPPFGCSHPLRQTGAISIISLDHEIHKIYNESEPDQAEALITYLRETALSLEHSLEKKKEKNRGDVKALRDVLKREGAL